MQANLSFQALRAFHLLAGRSLLSKIPEISIDRGMRKKEALPEGCRALFGISIGHSGPRKLPEGCRSILQKPSAALLQSIWVLPKRPKQDPNGLPEGPVPWVRGWKYVVISGGLCGVLKAFKTTKKAFEQGKVVLKRLSRPPWKQP